MSSRPSWGYAVFPYLPFAVLAAAAGVVLVVSGAVAMGIVTVLGGGVLVLVYLQVLQWRDVTEQGRRDGRSSR